MGEYIINRYDYITLDEYNEIKKVWDNICDLINIINDDDLDDKYEWNNYIHYYVSDEGYAFTSEVVILMGNRREMKRIEIDKNIIYVLNIKTDNMFRKGEYTRELFSLLDHTDVYKLKHDMEYFKDKIININKFNKDEYFKDIYEVINNIN